MEDHRLSTSESTGGELEQLIVLSQLEHEQMPAFGDSRVTTHCAGNEAKITDRKSTRLNSSHVVISYAVFCLKKKTSPPLLPSSPLLFHITV